MATKLFYTSDFAAAEAEIHALGGRITQKFTDALFEAHFPDGVDVARGKAFSATAPDNLDDLSRMLAQAWGDMEAGKALKSATPEAPLPWDTPGRQHPRNPRNDPQLRAHAEQHLKKTLIIPPATSRMMTNKITVGLVIVGGSNPSLAFSDAETQGIVTQVMGGLQFLSHVTPRANITFIYDIFAVTIDSALNPNCLPGTGTWEACESVVRDPALKALGYPAGSPGLDAFVQTVLKGNKSDWAYAAFITKYPLNHFAYQYNNVVFMNYSNDGWGPHQIDRVFAHETCHAFGAADEYASSNCTCAASGTLKVPNFNCDNCDSPYGHSDCLMKANTFSICCWSQGQLGWLVPLASGSPASMVYGSAMHVPYRDTNNHISDLYYNNGWKYADLNTLASGPPSAQGDPFPVVYGGAMHVLYRDANNHISDLYYDNGWKYADLNTLVSGPPSAQGDPFPVVYGSAMHVLYHDTNNHISDLYYDNGWKYADLNTLASGPPSAQGDPFPVVYGSAMHVLYRDASNHISDLYYNSGWNYADLNTLVSEPPTAQGNHSRSCTATRCTCSIAMPATTSPISITAEDGTTRT
jgi:hypothetical protein